MEEEGEEQCKRVIIGVSNIITIAYPPDKQRGRKSPDAVAVSTIFGRIGEILLNSNVNSYEGRNIDLYKIENDLSEDILDLSGNACLLLLGKLLHLYISLGLFILDYQSERIQNYMKVISILLESKYLDVNAAFNSIQSDELKEMSQYTPATYIISSLSTLCDFKLCDFNKIYPLLSLLLDNGVQIDRGDRNFGNPVFLALNQFPVSYSKEIILAFLIYGTGNKVFLDKVKYQIKSISIEALEKIIDDLEKEYYEKITTTHTNVEVTYMAALEKSLEAMGFHNECPSALVRIILEYSRLSLRELFNSDSKSST